MENHQPLPTPRILLTSLLTTLFTSSSNPPVLIPSHTNPNTHNNTPDPNSRSTTYARANQNQNQPHPPNQDPNPSSANPPYTALQRESNPLKGLSPGQKALLSTLHVLFPPPMLLQSLDLLDRGLVGRVVYLGSGGEADGEGDGEGGAKGYGVVDETRNEEIRERGDGKVEGVEEDKGSGMGREREIPMSNPGRSESSNIPKADSRISKATIPPQENLRLSKSPSLPSHPNLQPSTSTQHPTIIYQVQSSQPPPKSRFSHTHTPGFTNTSGSGIYTVYLDAWNCSCAAFTFSAFPYTGSGSGSSSDSSKNYSYEKLFDDRSGQDHAPDSDAYLDRGLSGREKEDEGNRDRGWEFGGLSAKYTYVSDDESRGEGENIPICKHLLACLLVEKWEVLRGFAREKKCTGREEVAGLVVES